jgi:DNA N-6-adenine-methyltransferase (Dam)
VSYWEAPGKSDEWLTPPYIFAALGCKFDMDVAAPAGGGSCVPAAHFLTEKSNCAWNGFIWMNPPFGGRNSLSPWMNKFFAHGNGIALTPDRTSAPWFQEAWPRAHAILFTRKIRFLRLDGTEGKAPSNGTALWAAGEAATEILRQSSLGIFTILTGRRAVDLVHARAALTETKP